MSEDRLSKVARGAGHRVGEGNNPSPKSNSESYNSMSLHNSPTARSDFTLFTQPIQVIPGPAKGKAHRRTSTTDPTPSSPRLDLAIACAR